MGIWQKIRDFFSNEDEEQINAEESTLQHAPKPVLEAEVVSEVKDGK